MKLRILVGLISALATPLLADPIAMGAYDLDENGEIDYVALLKERGPDFDFVYVMNDTREPVIIENFTEETYEPHQAGFTMTDKGTLILQLYVSYEWQAGEILYKFSWRDGDLKLIGYTDRTNARDLALLSDEERSKIDPSICDVNFLTGDVEITKGQTVMTKTIEAGARDVEYAREIAQYGMNCTGE